MPTKYLRPNASAVFSAARLAYQQGTDDDDSTVVTGTPTGASYWPAKPGVSFGIENVAFTPRSSDDLYGFVWKELSEVLTARVLPTGSNWTIQAYFPAVDAGGNTLTLVARPYKVKLGSDGHLSDSTCVAIGDEMSVSLPHGLGQTITISGALATEVSLDDGWSLVLCVNVKVATSVGAAFSATMRLGDTSGLTKWDIPDMRIGFSSAVSPGFAAGVTNKSNAVGANAQVQQGVSPAVTTTMNVSLKSLVSSAAHLVASTLALVGIRVATTGSGQVATSTTATGLKSIVTRMVGRVVTATTQCIHFLGSTRSGFSIATDTSTEEYGGTIWHDPRLDPSVFTDPLWFDPRDAR